MKNEAQAERLAILAEELSEAGQVIGKSLRHGLDSDFTGETNQALLEKELGDILAAICLLRYNKDLNLENIETAMKSKMKKFKNGQAFLHHQKFGDDWPETL